MKASTLFRMRLIVLILGKENWSLLKWREVNKNQFLKLWPKKVEKKNKNKKQKKRKIVSLGLFWSRHVDVLFIISCLFSLPLPLSLSFFFLFVLLLVSRRIKPFLEFQLNFHDNIKISSSSKLSNSRVKLIQQQQQTHRHHHLPSISATYFIVYLTTQLPGLWSLLSLMVMFCLVFCHTRRCNNSRISKHDLISRRFFFLFSFFLYFSTPALSSMAQTMIIVMSCSTFHCVRATATYLCCRQFSFFLVVVVRHNLRSFCFSVAAFFVHLMMCDHGISLRHFFCWCCCWWLADWLVGWLLYATEFQYLI